MLQAHTAAHEFLRERAKAHAAYIAARGGRSSVKAVGRRQANHTTPNSGSGIIINGLAQAELERLRTICADLSGTILSPLLLVLSPLLLVLSSLLLVLSPLLLVLSPLLV